MAQENGDTQAMQLTSLICLIRLLNASSEWGHAINQRLIVRGQLKISYAQEPSRGYRGQARFLPLEQGQYGLLLPRELFLWIQPASVVNT